MSKLLITTTYPCCGGRAFVVLLPGTVKKKCPRCGQVWKVEVEEGKDESGEFTDVWWTLQEETRRMK